MFDTVDSYVKLKRSHNELKQQLINAGNFTYNKKNMKNIIIKNFINTNKMLTGISFHCLVNVSYKTTDLLLPAPPIMSKLV